MNFIKTLVCAAVLAALTIPTTANAQLSLGLGLAYGTDIEEFGIQPRIQYQFSEQWRASFDLLYYLEGIEDLAIYELNPNVHYIFSNTGSAAFYALAGLNILTASIDLGQSGRVSDSETGFNLGLGTTFGSGGLRGQAEVKYEIHDGGQLVIGAGVLIPVGQ